MRVNIRRPCKSLPTAMVGTRSRGSRRRLSDHDIRCSASDRRWFPARPAQHVHRRRNNAKGPIQSALASAHGRNGERRGETCNALQRRTRRSVSTLGGAAPDTIIGRAAADHAGARPYRAHVAKTRRNAPRRIARNASPPLAPEPLQLLTPEFLKSTRFARIPNAGKMLTLRCFLGLTTRLLFTSRRWLGLRTLFFVGFARSRARMCW